MLAQGLTLAPEDWPYPLAQRYIFFDLTDEDSPSADVEGITEPVLVGLAIRASRKDWLGPVPVPSEGEGVAAIRWMCKQQRKKGRYSTARPDLA